MTLSLFLAISLFIFFFFQTPLALSPLYSRFTNTPKDIDAERGKDQLCSSIFKNPQLTKRKRESAGALRRKEEEMDERRQEKEMREEKEGKKGREERVVVFRFVLLRVLS